MQFDNPLQLVVALPGSALKVLMALLFARNQNLGALSEDRLQTYSGLSQNTVRKGLKTLILYDLVQRNGDLWALASGAKQLSILELLLGEKDASQNLTLTLEAGPVGETTSQNLTRDDPERQTDEGQNSPETGKSTQKTGESANFESNIDSKNCTRLVGLDINPDTRNESNQLVSAKPEIAAELERWGIDGKKFREILADPDPRVTALMIRFHCETVENAGKETGLAIWRIQNHKPVGKRWLKRQQEQALYQAALSQDDNDAAEELPTAEAPAESGTSAPDFPAPPAELLKFWQMILGQLRMQINRPDYESWVEPLRVIEERDGVLRIGGANQYALDWVRSRLTRTIDGLASGVMGKPIRTEFELWVRS